MKQGLDMGLNGWLKAVLTLTALDLGSQLRGSKGLRAGSAPQPPSRVKPQSQGSSVLGSVSLWEVLNSRVNPMLEEP